MWLSSNCDGIEALLLAVSGGGGGCCDTWALDMLHWGHQSLVCIPFIYIYIYVFLLTPNSQTLFQTRFENVSFERVRTRVSKYFLRSELDERSLTTVSCWKPNVVSYTRYDTEYQYKAPPEQSVPLSLSLSHSIAL